MFSAAERLIPRLRGESHAVGLKAKKLMHIAPVSPLQQQRGDMVAE